jgi:uncharacterized protein YggU (UPF0235/DUF167 family)
MHPKSKKSMVEEVGGVLIVHTKSPAEGGKANREMITLLCEYLSITAQSLKIISGSLSPRKIVNVSNIDESKREELAIRFQQARKRR